jgi:hypothetical protein
VRAIRERGRADEQRDREEGKRDARACDRSCHESSSMGAPRRAEGSFSRFTETNFQRNIPTKWRAQTAQFPIPFECFPDF